MLLKIAALGALGYAGYKYMEGNRRKSGGAAFAAGQGGSVRDAGPEAMADTPRREWSEADEDSDESFPASDPPGNY